MVVVERGELVVVLKVGLKVEIVVEVVDDALMLMMRERK